MSDNYLYLAVLKASYNYDPQSDDELPIKENQLLLLLDKVDDDWWKVKIKSDDTDDEGPSGLVPAAYVEPADHVSVVRVLYDYEATSPGELSVQEDETLLVYEIDQDWLLVQSRKEGGNAGYVPGNYVETTNEEEESARAASVDMPTARPVSTYIDPADRVASSKVAQPNMDSIKTWPVTSIDKKGKKKKGTLGVGNGAIFFASESDKTPVQKWQTSDVSDATIEKGKQIRLDIGGNNPITLHYNAGSKDNAEAILEKVQSSLKFLSNSRTSQDLPVDGPSTSLASSTGRKVGKKVSVHFSQSDPVIIPPREEEEEEEEGEEYPENSSEEQRDGEEENGEPGEQAVALYDFSADGDDELSIKEGEKLIILEKDGDEWWKCTNSRGGEGVVPASYLQLQVTPQPVSSPPLPSRANATAERERAAAAREAEERASADRRRREAEQIQLEKARKKQEAQRAKEAAAAAAEAEKKKSKAEAVRSSSPATSSAPTKQSNGNGSAGRQSAELKFPPEDQVRTWHDRSGQFRVEAAFLGLSNNKIRLHKINGVIVEVPTEKMSVDDIRFVERSVKKSSKSNQKLSDDDVPLAVSRAQSSQKAAASKKSWDWFDFFLSAGCDLDDCTRYATSFEKDKIDEAILPDITDSTMRTLGLREGDIIRVSKAIEKKKPGGRSSKQANTQVQDQIRHDEELAKQLQAQETGGGSPRSPAPNLFAGPGGVLKARKRPQPTKSLPPNVDIKALSSASEQDTNSPQPNNSSSSTPVQAPARISSAAPAAKGFDDDAWTNRPNSTKPHSSTPPAATAKVPLSAPLVPTSGTTVRPVTPTPPSQSTNTTPPVNTAPSTAQPGTTASSSLAKTTEADIFDQLARLTELRGPGTPSNAPRSSPSPAITGAPPASYQVGLGMGPSLVPIGQHLQNQQLQSQQQPRLIPSPSPQAQAQPQPYNGPRGPYAPVPTNQSLLQPLVPTQTNFGGFVPTRPIGNNTNALGMVPSLQPPAPQPFLPPQATGLPNQVILSQPTGVPFSGFASTAVASSTFQGSGGFSTLPAPLQSQYTGFNPNVGQFPSNNFVAAPPVPPLPTSVASPAKDTSPASVFAQMKSGTFANEDGTQAQNAERYDALRPAPLLTQPTGWTAQYQTGYIGYPS